MKYGYSPFLVRISVDRSLIRGPPSEVVVGVDEGLKKDSAVNLDHVQTVEKARLKNFVGTVGSDYRESCFPGKLQKISCVIGMARQINLTGVVLVLL